MVQPLISRFLRGYAETEIQRRLRLEAGLLPISELAVEDIFLAAYPKSGITWLQNLIAGLLYGINSEYAPNLLIQTLIPSIPAHSYYKRLQTPMFFKTHEMPRPDFQRVIYLLRDGRDVAVSYHHYLEAVKGTPIDFLDLIRRPARYHKFGSWHEHVEAWLSNPYHAEMLVIRYEELRQEPVTVLARICEFTGLERSVSALEAAASSSSFEKMRRREALYGMDAAHWPKDQAFIRRGEVGSYRDEMPADVLDAFMTLAQSTLQKVGYTL
jgi:hypothetical protein